MIDIRNLSLTRGGAPVLRDVSVTIPDGGITALIGPNGAGKSTLFHVIAGLLRPDSGRVDLDGADLLALRPEARALRLALLAQGQAVVTRLTVRELVGFGRWPHHRGRPRAADHAAVEGAIAAFGLEPLAGRMLESLSGGQRQRAHVAMAYAQTTPWLLLDEPLAALDPRHARDVMERLRDLSRPESGGPGVVIVLHDLAMAVRFADHVVALRDGAVAFAGPAEEMLTTGRLSGLFETPLEVIEIGGRRVLYPD